MKRLMFIILAAALLSAGPASAQRFTLKSDDLGQRLSESQVYSGFGCGGKNISPALTWINAPPDTRSFAVTVFDPDARAGGGWWHWVIFNIPAGISGLKADAGRIEKNLAPAGSIQSVTDFGKPGFGGACPPQGDKAHRYVFTVYALGVPTLDFDAQTRPAVIASALERNAIAKASLVSHYQR
jgi:Raf kinase inhibitor-like YbhB/YbcL family protein